MGFPTGRPVWGIILKTIPYLDMVNMCSVIMYNHSIPEYAVFSFWRKKVFFQDGGKTLQI